MLKIKCQDELLDWTEFKNRVRNYDSFKGIHLTVELPTKQTTKSSLNPLTYKRFVQNRSELAEMRAEWGEFKKESVWLINALFAAAGVAFCAFFVTYRFDYGVVSLNLSVINLISVVEDSFCFHFRNFNLLY